VNIEVAGVVGARNEEVRASETERAMLSNSPKEGRHRALERGFFLSSLRRVLNAMLDQIIVALAQGDRVELRGFGVFSTKLRKARTGRNPRTGVVVSIPQKARPSFKAAKEMQARLNPEAAQMD
jgi:integration host factor subunit beta